MGVFVCAYNYIGFRLAAPPFSLSQTTIGFIFVLYLLGAVSSTVMGDLAGRVSGAGACCGSPLAIGLVGVAVTLPDTSCGGGRRGRAGDLGLLRRPFDRLELGRSARRRRARAGGGALSVLLLSRLEPGRLDGRACSISAAGMGRRCAALIVALSGARAARGAAAFQSRRRRAILPRR